jgi:FtsZ-binding cell division protein ZapB
MALSETGHMYLNSKIASLRTDLGKALQRNLDITIDNMSLRHRNYLQELEINELKAKNASLQAELSDLRINPPYFVPCVNRTEEKLALIKEGLAKIVEGL